MSTTELKSLLQTSLQPLLGELARTQQRCVIVLQGPQQWQTQWLQHWQQQQPFCAHIHSVEQSKNFRQWLGQNLQFVCVDWREQAVNYDVLAGMLGAINGGGALVLCLPPVISHSIQHLISTTMLGMILITPDKSAADAVAPLLSYLSEQPDFTPTELPNQAQTQWLQQVHQAPDGLQLLLADRGRGKSTALALAINQRLQIDTELRVIITAPKRTQTDTLMRWLAPSERVRFVAWDKLQKTAPHPHEVLVIDEAAGLPTQYLLELLHHRRVWLMATTIQGYEGCGRGFAVRMKSQLAQQYGAHISQFSTPVRFTPSDLLEQWLHHHLCLAEAQAPRFRAGRPLQLTFQHASELSQPLLQQVFQLLLAAHYQTAPNDLKRLLDDSQQHLALAYCDNDLVGVAWLATEGQLDQDIAAQVVSGKRRLPGHLLPQQLSYVWQQPQLATLNYWRIVRIAVAQPYRRHRIGSQLITAIIQQAQTAQVDIVGSSFARQSEVEAFWTAQQFQAVRYGLKVDAASGATSVIYLYPELVPSWRSYLEQQAQYAAAEQHWLVTGKLPSLSPRAAVLAAVEQGILSPAQARLDLALAQQSHA